MSKDNDEITIDFKKIKNFFKKKEKDLNKLNEDIKETEQEIKTDIEKESNKLEQLKKDEKEIEKAKSALKEEEKVISDIEKKEEEVTLDLKKIKQTLRSQASFLKKHGSVIAIILAILIPMMFGINYRMYPDRLPITEDWARNTIYNNIQSQVSAQISQQYPNLPDQNKQSLIASEFAKQIKAQEQQIEQQVQGTSNYFKQRFKNEDGQTYLLAIDPYLWYGQARNYITHGHTGNKIVNETSVYTLRNGRVDNIVSKQLHPVVIAQFYNIINFFNKDFTLLRAAYLIPVILIALAIIPTFFIAKRFSGNIGGLFAGMIVAINAALLGRTPAGFSDTDAYNITLPLYIVWLFLEAFETNDLKKKIALTTGAGFVTGLFAWVWSNGWSYIFNFVLGTIAIYIGYLIITNIVDLKKNIGKTINNTQIKGTLISLITYLAASSIFVSIFKGSRYFIAGFTRLIKFITLKEVGVKSLWPNVLTTVAEFNATELPAIISQMGGTFMFWLSLIGITLLLFNRKKINPINITYLIGSAVYYIFMIMMKNNLNNPIIFIIVAGIPIIVGLLKVLYLKEWEDIDIKLSILLTLWFLGTAFAFTRGLRFAILMVPAFALAFGIAVGIIYRYLTEIAIKELHIGKWVSKIVIILVLSLLLWSPIKDAKATALSEIPSMTDSWYESLTAIKDNSDDGIITSWWDFGHWFVTVAERRVTFDGADQGRRIHWVGKSLLTDNEDSNIGILRLLNCGQEEAPDVLDEYTQDTARTMDIIDEIIILEREDAKEILIKEGLELEEAEEVLEMTHCEDLIKQYYITSEDMIGKAAVWGHFGSWDFHKAKMWRTVRGKTYDEGTKILEEEFNLTAEKADQLFYEIQDTKADRWIAPWPGYRSDIQGCRESGEILECNNGAIINLTTMEAHFNTAEGIRKPTSLVYPTLVDIEEKMYRENTVAVSVILMKDGNSYTSILSDPALAKSMFTRLFFYNGLGLEHYTLLSDRTTINNQRIQVWVVDWEAHEPITNDKAKTGSSIKLNYIGWLDDETVFDSSIIGWQDKGINKNSQLSDTYEYNPLSFQVGSGQVIPGFDNAVIGMKINEEKTFEIPPEEAYGTDPSAHQLGNQTLNFKIKVVDIS